MTGRLLLNHCVTVVAVAALLLALGNGAQACPDCEVGRMARHLAWTEGFGLHLAAVALPFVLVAGVAVFVERLCSRRAARPAPDPMPVDRTRR